MSRCLVLHGILKIPELELKRILQDRSTNRSHFEELQKQFDTPLRHCIAWMTGHEVMDRRD